MSIYFAPPHTHTHPTLSEGPHGDDLLRSVNVSQHAFRAPKIAPLQHSWGSRKRASARYGLKGQVWPIPACKTFLSCSVHLAFFGGILPALFQVVTHLCFGMDLGQLLA